MRITSYLFGPIGIYSTATAIRRGEGEWSEKRSIRNFIVADFHTPSSDVPRGVCPGPPLTSSNCKTTEIVFKSDAILPPNAIAMASL